MLLETSMETPWTSTFLAHVSLERQLARGAIVTSLHTAEQHRRKTTAAPRDECRRHGESPDNPRATEGKEAIVAQATVAASWTAPPPWPSGLHEGDTPSGLGSDSGRSSKTGQTLDEGTAPRSRSFPPQRPPRPHHIVRTLDEGTAPRSRSFSPQRPPAPASHRGER